MLKSINQSINLLFQGDDIASWLDFGLRLPLGSLET
jgi:hypothetical protein